MTNNMYRLRLSGLDEWQGAIRAMQSKMPKALTVAFNRGADVIVSAARPQVPRRTGRAAGTLKAKSTPAGVAIKAGGSDAPYFAWLDYGGRVGRKKKTKRRFIREGRYVWPTLREKRDEINDAVIAELRELAQSEGLEVR